MYTAVCIGGHSSRCFDWQEEARGREGDAESGRRERSAEGEWRRKEGGESEGLTAAAGRYALPAETDAPLAGAELVIHPAGRGGGGPGPEPVDPYASYRGGAGGGSGSGSGGGGGGAGRREPSPIHSETGSSDGDSFASALSEDDSDFSTLRHPSGSFAMRPASFGLSRQASPPLLTFAAYMPPERCSAPTAPPAAPFLCAVCTVLLGLPAVLWTALLLPLPSVLSRRLDRVDCFGHISESAGR